MVSEKDRVDILNCGFSATSNIKVEQTESDYGTVERDGTYVGFIQRKNGGWKFSGDDDGIELFSIADLEEIVKQMKQIN